MRKLLANTHKQLLSEHSFAVGYLAQQIFNKLFMNESDRSRCVFISGAFHDIGKTDIPFQDWVHANKPKHDKNDDGQHIPEKVKNFSFNDYPRHNEISTVLYYLLDNKQYKKISPYHKDNIIRHCIYWHHASPYRKKEARDKFDSFDQIYSFIKNDINELLDTVLTLVEEIKTLDIEYNSISILDDMLIKPNDEIYVEKIEIPKYKEYYDIKSNSDISYFRDIQIPMNAFATMVRSCVITADNIISALSSQELSSHITNKTLHNLIPNSTDTSSSLVDNIQQCLINFDVTSERSIKQDEISSKLTNIDDDKLAVLSGPAGCGKTKIALEWAMKKHAKKILWICPRIDICKGIFDELTSSKYLPNSNIELNIGDIKCFNTIDNILTEDKYFSGDVIITTIDQLFGSMVTHNKTVLLVDLLQYHMVFDEFHEYTHQDIFNILFAEMLYINKQKKVTNTLLVSATPNYGYLKYFVDVDVDEIIEMPSFNPSLYTYNFIDLIEDDDEHNVLLQKQNHNNTAVISNTAKTAQNGFMRNKTENSILYHSKYTKNDKINISSLVYDCFKEDGNIKYDILRSGPIVQASLNISFEYMISEHSTPENILQRKGRLGRFSKDKNKEYFFNIAVPRGIIDGKVGQGSSTQFLSRLHQFKTAMAFYKYISTENTTKRTLNEYYKMYKGFYTCGDYENDIVQDLTDSINSSVKGINRKIYKPFIMYKTKTKNKSDTAKISKNSLRGNNVFVQLAKLYIDQNGSKLFINEYANDNITLSVDEVQGRGDSDKNLLAFHHKYNHKIFGGKKPHKDYVHLINARDSSTPIYLSYTPEHLGDNIKNSNYAYYYVTDNRQSIGLMSITDL